MSTQVSTVLPIKLEPYINPDDTRYLSVQMAASLTLPKGTVLGQITASGKYKAYASGNSDGSQAARAILPYDIVTDANGNVILGPSGSVLDAVHTQDQSVQVYTAGNFLVSELVGYDATALSTFGGREFGISTSKYVHIP